MRHPVSAKTLSDCLQTRKHPIPYKSPGLGYRNRRLWNVSVRTRSNDFQTNSINSAKHLHSPEEQLTSLAGSFGYVAPEVLNKTGHGKAVDIWSIGYVPQALSGRGAHVFHSIITYVLLCGYSPFRSEDAKELVRETTQAKVEFHDRYWKNVSEEGNSSTFWPYKCSLTYV